MFETFSREVGSAILAIMLSLIGKEVVILLFSNFSFPLLLNIEYKLILELEIHMTVVHMKLM